MDTFLPIKAQEKIQIKSEDTQGVLCGMHIHWALHIHDDRQRGLLSPGDGHLAQACSRSLNGPNGQYYLADAGLEAITLGSLGLCQATCDTTYRSTANE